MNIFNKNDHWVDKYLDNACRVVLIICLAMAVLNNILR